MSERIWGFVVKRAIEIDAYFTLHPTRTILTVRYALNIEEDCSDSKKQPRNGAIEPI